MSAKRYFFVRTASAVALISTMVLVACTPASSLRGANIAPAVISPNGDGQDDQATIDYTLQQKSSISITMVSASGKEYSFRRGEERSAGSYAAIFDGTYSPDPDSPARRVMPDGDYEVVLEAVPLDASGNPSGQAQPWRGRIALQGGDTNPPVVSNVVSRYGAISPNGDAEQDETDISYGLSKKATVTITASDAAGNGYMLSPPASRSAALYSHIWNGTTAEVLLPDGAYTIHIQALDVAGNLSEATTTVSVQGGGTPSLEITRVKFSPSAVPIGGDLNVEIRVRNSGNVPLPTLGPAPGRPYDTGINFNNWKGPGEVPLYYERAGVWRVGVQWSTAGQSYPVRWGLTPDLEPLQPGQEAVITGTIKVNIDRTEEVYFWVSAVQEGVGFPGGRVGQQRIKISF